MSPAPSSMMILLPLLLGMMLSGCNKGSDSNSRPLTEQEKARLDPKTFGGAPDEPKTSEASDLECFHALCDDSPKFTDHRFFRPAPATMATLQKLIEQKYALQAQISAASFNRASQLKFDQIKFDDQMGDLFYAIYSMSRFSGARKYLVRNNQLRHFEVDRVQYLKDHGNDPDRIPADMLDLLDTYLKMPWVEISMQGLELWDFAKYAYPSYPTASIVRSLTTSALQTQKQVDTLLGFKESPVTSAQKKALAGQELSKVDSQNLISLYISTAFFDMVLKGELKGSYAKSGFAGSSAYQSLLKVPLEKLRSRMERAQRQNPAQCAKHLKRSIEGSLPEVEIAQFKQGLDLTKQLARQEAQTLIKDPARQREALDRIKGLKFKFADSQEQMSQTIQNSMKEQIISAQAMLGQVPSDQGLLLMVLTSSAQVQQEEKSGAVTDSENEECDDFPVDRPTDFALTSENKISVSAASMRASTLGFTVAAHEIGHVVFRALNGSDSPALDLPSLKQQGNPVLSCEADRLANSLPLLNEGFADSFAAHVMRRWPDSPQATIKNLGCPFLKSEEIKLKFGAEVEGDSHPSYFYRSLSWQQNFKGTMPASCQASLTRNGYGPLTSCW